jgi:5,10-methylenetetrahydrofolate reductase
LPTHNWTDLPHYHPKFVFEAARKRSFIGRCRAAGIACPILPGLQPISECASTRLLSRT